MSRVTLIAWTLAVPLLFAAPLGCDDGTQIGGELVLVDKVLRDLKVTSIRPEAGPLAGGTLIILTGEGFEADMTVAFGDNAAAQVYVGGDELAALYTPAGAGPGAVDVTVTRKSDGQSTTVAGGYTYERDDVVLSEVIPYAGSFEGNTLVTIVGKGFTDGATVTFGANAAINDSRIKALGMVS
ncbi:MAG TPA: IPT/TIG domain-containing protein, partial [Myxococcota bacterium]|nr:IPT/TIG domain-containing protein [Myxococcota bacterium]